MDTPNTPSSLKTRRILAIILRVIGCIVLLGIGTVLALISSHFFERGGAILAVPALTAFSSAGILAIARNKQLLQFGALLGLTTCVAFVYFGMGL